MRFNKPATHHYSLNLNNRVRYSPINPFSLQNLDEDDLSVRNSQAVDQLLNRSGDCREWRYLNKGTHEEDDRVEFDRQTVELIIMSLEQLDAALQ